MTNPNTQTGIQFGQTQTTPEVNQSAIVTAEQQGHEPDTFLEDHSLGHLANMTVEAHGRTVSLREGLECEPFKKMIEGIIKGHEQSMANLPLSEEQKQTVKETVLLAAVVNTGKETAKPEIQAEFQKKN